MTDSITATAIIRVNVLLPGGSEEDLTRAEAFQLAYDISQCLGLEIADADGNYLSRDHFDDR